MGQVGIWEETVRVPQIKLNKEFLFLILKRIASHGWGLGAAPSRKVGESLIPKRVLDGIGSLACPLCFYFSAVSHKTHLPVGEYNAKRLTANYFFSGKTSVSSQQLWTQYVILGTLCVVTCVIW